MRTPVWPLVDYNGQLSALAATLPNSVFQAGKYWCIHFRIIIMSHNAVCLCVLFENERILEPSTTGYFCFIRHNSHYDYYSMHSAQPGLNIAQDQSPVSL